MTKRLQQLLQAGSLPDLEHDVVVRVAGQSDRAEEQHEQFEHGSIVM